MNRTSRHFGGTRGGLMGGLSQIGKLPGISATGDRYIRETAKLFLNYRGRRRAVVRGWMFDALRFLTPMVAVEGSNRTRYFVGTSEWIGRCVYSDGFYEERMMAMVIDIISAMRGGPPPLKGRRFIDVGANIGTASITAISVFGAEDAIGFEPAPDNFKLLQCNLIMNELSSRVRVFQVALSNSPGTAILELSPENCGDHRVRTTSSSNNGLFQEAERPTLKVKLVRLDDLIAELEVDVRDVGLMWIDTQGHEGHVLEGAKTVLRSHVPVVLEYWPYGLRRAGGLDLLHSIIAENYSTVVDLSPPRATTSDYRAQDINQLAEKYEGGSTDLLLIK
jgi:FkbM family methyltransferase